MKILHVVDYLMPNMGYQEFILPKLMIENEVTILTGNAFIQSQIIIILEKIFEIEFSNQKMKLLKM